jgi:hypothetical protein
MSRSSISDTWSLFKIEPNPILELRAIHYKDKRPQSHIFKAAEYESLDALKEAFEHEAAELNKKGWNIYTNLNPIHPGYQEKSAKDQDIVHRSLLLIDIDRTGDTKFPATDGEIKKAEALVVEIVKYLGQRGWPKPGVVMSGNGYHLYFRLDDLPNDDRSKLLVTGVLKFLATKFNNEHVSIDTTVSNASRITKVPGTLARKGEETQDRPYRVATLIGAPSHKRLVTSLMLEELLQLNSDMHSNATPLTPQPTSSRFIENQENIAKLKKALSYISSDVSRGRGAIDITNPKGDNWLGCIWAIAGLGWGSGMDIAREWSKKSDRYDETSFERDWASYDPTHPNPIGVGSVFKLAEACAHIEFGPLVFADQKSTATKTVISEQLEFKFYTAQELRKLPPLAWRIKGLLPETGLASVYGPSGSGKSFFIIDLLANIALGEPFYGHKVISCPVVYVALEGSGGVPNRISAYEEHFGRQLPDTFSIVTERISLFYEDVGRFGHAVVACGFNKGVIVIDTLNQSAPEADENTSSDMGTIIKNAQILQKMTNSLVILVHHTGKDASRGARGHSSFFAALDAGIELKKTQSGREWMVSKSKDGEDGISHPFKLMQVLLGKDEDGDDITSCVVQPDIFRAEQPKPPQGKNQKAILAYLKANMGSTQKTKTEIVSIAKEAISGSNQMTRTKEVVDKLIDQRQLVEEDGKYYIYDSLEKKCGSLSVPL